MLRRRTPRRLEAPGPSRKTPRVALRWTLEMARNWTVYACHGGGLGAREAEARVARPRDTPGAAQGRKGSHLPRQPGPVGSPRPFTSDLAN